MAYFKRRRGSTAVTVYYWDPKLGRAQPLRRSETEHLDGLPDIEVARWVEEWERTGDKGRQRSRRRALLNVDDLKALVASYLADHKASSDPPPRDDTLKDYLRDFERYILPFFVAEKAVKDVRKWYLYTEEFPGYLVTTHKLSPGVVRKVRQNLLRFGLFLVRRHILVQPWTVQRRRNRNRRKSPLVRKMDPEEVLKVAQSLVTGGKSEGALALLLGYFATLRPEELFALETGDFLYSTEARQRAKTWAGFQKQGLGSGLSVIISRTLTKLEPDELTKTHYSVGVVNVFSPDAAKMLAKILSTHEEGRLFPGTRWQCNGGFKKNVKSLIKLNPQDLRRASGNYLGKRRGVDPFTLQDHMRHAEMTTTMLYCRDPAARDEDQAGKRNFEDVG